MSAFTTSFSGRIATMSAGVRPSIFRAVLPTLNTWPVRRLTATTEGSLRTIPRPRTWTSVLAVPRSMPMSLDQRPRTVLTTFKAGNPKTFFLEYRGGAHHTPQVALGGRQDHIILGQATQAPSPTRR